MSAVVLLSGGLDSTVALFLAQTRHDNVRALSIDYGQRHSVELHRAAEIAAIAGVPRETLHVVMPWTGGALVDGSNGPPSSRAAVVPGRNAILTTIAAAYALTHGADRVWIGCNLDDAEVFADCRPEWIGAMSRTLSLGVAPGLSLVAPFVDRTKAQIVEMARGLGDACWRAVERSWSCYSPRVTREAAGCGCGSRLCPLLCPIHLAVSVPAEWTPCGECGACLARAKAGAP